jgi:phosphoserine aminotransferase
MNTPVPAMRPVVPNFSCGPVTKPPGWSTDALKSAVLGRSHRSKIGKARIKLAIDMTREVLEVPADYRIGIVPGSDTGAVEMAMWSLLGARGVDVVAWESFGEGWVTDAVQQLRLPDLRTFVGEYGELPDLDAVDAAERDVVFTWNGTTSGARVPNADWIPADRKGLTICDATSAAFAQELDWAKLDVVTFSWQKVLGGEAAHGIIILSPRAVERLLSYTPTWPIPKLFRLVEKGKLLEGIFQGETINTPSMLAVEDCIISLTWANSIGGLKGMIARADRNAAVIDRWAEKSRWVAHLTADPSIRSNTSVCLSFRDPAVTALPKDAQNALAKAIEARLDKEGVAFDIAGYRDAPPGLRIWCGATVETSDLEALTHWLDWAYEQVAAETLKQAA